MNGLNLKVKELMTFVPAGKNYEIALQFYQDLGFEVVWKSDELAVLRIEHFRFFLQNFHNEEMQNNFMMSLEVENLDDWWKRIQDKQLKENYEGVRVKAPEVYPWGKREIHLIDPAGVLWHIAVSA